MGYITLNPVDHAAAVCAALELFTDTLAQFHNGEREIHDDVEDWDYAVIRMSDDRAEVAVWDVSIKLVEGQEGVFRFHLSAYPINEDYNPHDAQYPNYRYDLRGNSYDYGHCVFDASFSIHNLFARVITAKRKDRLSEYRMFTQEAALTQLEEPLLHNSSSLSRDKG